MISCSKTKNILCFTARYRGYCYDNKTGYYYLQSRYYAPDLGRFISADDFSYVDTSHKLNVNAYSYCWNSPIALEDAEGTTPQISIDLSALQPLLEDTAELIKTGISKLTENIQKLMSKYNDFIDKLEFNINHPDVVINNGLSKILGREVSIKFPLINAIRAYFGTFDIRTGELVGGAGDGYHTSDSDNEENGIAAYSSRSDSSCDIGTGSPLHVISVILTEIFVCLDLQKLANDLDISFGFSGLEEYRKLKADIYYKANNKGMLSSIGNISSFLSNVFSISAPLEKLSNAFGWVGYISGTLTTLDNKVLSPSGKGRVMTYDLGYAFFGLIVMSSVVTGGVGTLPAIVIAGGLAAGGYFLHRYAEKDSYSSYWELGW